MLAQLGRPVWPSATYHTLRHWFATHSLQVGYDIRIVWDLVVHREVKTAMTYTHVLNRGEHGVRGQVKGL
ncbi:MAG: tyrosine-type recombinase/integrase [bacterium]|nr:tyrosine-type recombinase/integrase [bacterium]